jgi:hypothetical protein
VDSLLASRVQQVCPGCCNRSKSLCRGTSGASSLALSHLDTEWSVDAGCRGGDAVVAQFELPSFDPERTVAAPSRIAYEGWNAFEIHG